MFAKQFIETLVEEKDGFSFDQPWRLEEKGLGVIIPILRNAGDKKRQYIVLSEARNVKIEDTGQIDAVYVKNNDEQPILISRGEIFRGKTQERAAVHDFIVMPGDGLRVAVKCIHANKGISGGAEMKSGGFAPYGTDFRSQETTWQSVSMYASQMGQCQGQSSSPTMGFYGHCTNTANLPHEFSNTARMVFDNSDLVSTLDDVVANIKEAMRKIPHINNQVGAAFFAGNDFRGMDIYDFPASWEALKNDIVAKEGASFLKKKDCEMFKFDSTKGIELLKKTLGQPIVENTFFSGPYISVEFSTDTYCGELVQFHDEIIHLTVWEKPKNK